MCYPLLRPVLFALPPEVAHALTLEALGLAGRLLPPLPPVGAGAVTLAGLEFPNRVGLAAGYDKNGLAVDGLARLGFGFIEIGTVTPLPQTGHERPRLLRVPRARALLNRLGSPNLGATAVAARLRTRRSRGILGINIGKNSATPNARAVDDYLACFAALSPVADYLAVNVSSPNTAKLRELQQAEQLGPILEALAEARALLERGSGRRLPLFVKISPDLEPGRIADLARLIDACGIDGVIASNTTVAREALDLPPLQPDGGGLSGAPLLPLALAAVRRVRSALPRATLIGCGGIDTGAAAVEMRRAGADLVQLYTGLVYRGPRLVTEVAAALAPADAGAGRRR